jgi:hypothetical protein
MKATALMLLALLLGGAIFVGGFYTGKTRSINATSMVLIGSSALDSRTVLRMLDKADIEAARKYINSAVDADILQLQALLQDSSDVKLATRTREVLTVIANDRKGHVVEKNSALPDVDKKVQAVLELYVTKDSHKPTTHD